MADDFGQYMPQAAPQQPTPTADFSQYMGSQQQAPITGGDDTLGQATGLAGTAKAIAGGVQDAASNMVNALPEAHGIGDDIAPGNNTKQAMIDNPKAALIGKGIGYVGATAGAIAASSMVLEGAASMAPEALGAVASDGALNATASNAIAGSLLAGPGNRIMGGIIGAVTTPISAAVTGTANYLIKASTINTVLKTAVGKITSMVKGTPDIVAANGQANVWSANKAVEDQLFNSFRNTSGHVDGGLVAAQGAQFLNKFGDELSATQRASVEDLIVGSAKAKDLADLHDTRKFFAYDNSKFFDEQPLVSSKAFQAYGDLKGSMDSVMRNNAENLGVGERYNAANAHYQNNMLPLINTGAKKTSDALANAGKNPLAASKITDGLINRYVKVGKPDTAQAFLNTLDPAGRQAVEVQAVQNIMKKATISPGTVDYVAARKGIQEHLDSLGNIFTPRTKGILQGLDQTLNEATHLGGIELNMSRVSAPYKIGAAASIVGGASYEAYEGNGVPLAGAAFALGLTKLIGTSVGQQLLIKASGPAGQAIGKSIVSGILIQGALNTPPTSTMVSNGK